MKVLAIYGSSRANGNTDHLTDLVVEGLPCTKIYLRDKRIEAIEDRRHTAEGFQPVDDDYDQVISEVLSHDILIFATPLYWYGMSGRMKDFVDRWSQSLRDKPNFKEEMSRKKGYVIIVGGDNPRVKALPLVQQFQYIFDFVSIDFGGYVIGSANRPGDIMGDDRALFEARKMKEEIVQLINQRK
ncbi:flavodoxin family protein [Brevibacillus sp. LEMMJ03]|jgi:multimeric flavodoxin WrbA|uniref:Flavodoxin family protein n=1 Tax=Brevibacillus thermoruber TaxID=33942 RepID=A0A9X3TP81_9BACL|nr:MULTISPECIES: flavodoxin family protein [Brevibacillus]MDA5107983.1 flavodoxin family protein [Brevibacillus thermoruber]TRY26603.1 flavodoxin family protein [Brevibacillus sp. LEMMJ03]